MYIPSTLARFFRSWIQTLISQYLPMANFFNSLHDSLDVIFHAVSGFSAYRTRHFLCCSNTLYCWLLWPNKFTVCLYQKRIWNRKRLGLEWSGEKTGLNKRQTTQQTVCVANSNSTTKFCTKSEIIVHYRMYYFSIPANPPPQCRITVAALLHLEANIHIDITILYIVVFMCLESTCSLFGQFSLSSHCI